MAASIAAIYLSVRNHMKLIGEMAQIRRSWLILLRKYELLWNQGIIDGYSSTIDKIYERLRTRQDEITHKESELPDDKRMLRECQNAVKCRRNIKN